MTQGRGAPILDIEYAVEEPVKNSRGDNMKIDIQYNIGKAKYVVNFSNGTKRHADGSEFFDIAIFKNKEKMKSFITQLKSR